MKQAVRLRAQARILRTIASNSEAGEEHIRDQLLALARQCDDLATACERPEIESARSASN